MADHLKDQRVKLFNEYTDHVLRNPHMSKKALCEFYGYSESAINNIRKLYDLPSPFYIHNKKSGSRKLSEDEKLERNIKRNDKDTKKQQINDIQTKIKESNSLEERKQLNNQLKTLLPPITETNTPVISKVSRKRKDKKAGRGPIYGLPEVVHSRITESNNLGTLSTDELQLIINRRNAAQTSGSQSISTNPKTLNDIIVGLKSANDPDSFESMSLHTFGKKI